MVTMAMVETFCAWTKTHRLWGSEVRFSLSYDKYCIGAWSRSGYSVSKAQDQLGLLAINNPTSTSWLDAGELLVLGRRKLLSSNDTAG